jgi:hypothetical protein
MLSEVPDHLREDIAKINECSAEALFETTAETLDGLITAFEDYERGQEEAWRDEAWGPSVKMASGNLDVELGCVRELLTAQ